MPIYVYTCPKQHSFEKFKSTPYKRTRRYRCKRCGLWATRNYSAEHNKNGRDIHLDYGRDPVSHLVKKRSFKGITIDALTPEPVRVTSEAQYRALLRRTNSQEKMTGEH